MSARRAELDGVLVCTRSDLVSLPRVELPPNVSIREMDTADASDRRAWLAVHNAAYGHAWQENEFRAAVTEHRHIHVTHTFLLEADGEPVGVASIGHFRRNERVGAGHYLAVDPRAQRTGLGRVLVAYRYHELRSLGFDDCESQTHIGRTPSLLLHFDCGFHPKWRLDTWNNPDTWSRPVRALTNARLFALYERWTRTTRAQAQVRP